MQGQDAGTEPASHWHAHDQGEAAARARLEVLFTGLDRLTPDSLGLIGLRRDDGAARHSLLRAVDEAAEAWGRTHLLDEARSAARDMVMGRYSAGTLHPTWVGLNWGVSQGRIEDRVAIVLAVEDAAAAAVLADVIDPSIVDALSLDAEHVVDLSTGDVSEGSLAHAVAPPPHGFHDTRVRQAGVGVGALVVGTLAGTAVTLVGAVFGTVEVMVGAGFAGAAVAAGIVFALARRDRP